MTAAAVVPGWTTTGRVLVVEDNAELAIGLAHALRMAGHEVRVAHDGLAGLAEARRAWADLVVLDLMLPGLDGLEVLRALRSGGLAVPVLVLTARGDETEKVTGLRLGADDYVTKPFGVLELLARVEALLRRTATRTASAGWEEFGALRLHRPSRTVQKRGAALDLAPKEFDLLVALVDRRDRVVPRVELLEVVWGYSAAVVSRTVDTHVAALRRKLEDDPAAPAYVLTVLKSGYRFRG